MEYRFNYKKLLHGAKLSLPIVAGYIPLGIGCGVLAYDVGLSVFQSAVMSLLVFAGMGQYISIGMIGAGAAPAAIILTVTIVNIRHFLYTSSMYPYVKNWSPLKKAAFAAQITDETFGLNSSEMSKNGGDFWVSVGINVFSHSGWIIGNCIGTLLGSIIGDSKSLGLDFALPALFIALLVPYLRSKPNITAAVTAGIISVFCAINNIPMGLVIAGIFGAAAAMIPAVKTNA